MKKLYIGGVDRWHNYVMDSLMGHSLGVEAVLTYQMDIAHFKIRGERPIEGQEVIIEDDTIDRVFGGTIVKVDLASTLSDRSVSVWNVDCDDFTNELNQKLVVETYENVSADFIFRDIVSKYCRGFTVNGVRSGAPTIEKIIFNYLQPSECFKQLCDYIGWHWMPDYFKDLKFFSAEELAQPAPMKVIPGGNFRNIKHTVDTQGLHNRIFVRGGTMLSDLFTYEIKADGVARTWILPHKPHDITMKLNGVATSVGIENVHQESDYAYLMNFQEKYIRASEQTPIIAAGTTISWIYQYDVDVITTVDDPVSQEAMKKAQDNSDGVYEYAINDNSLTTIQAAEAAGTADLRENANPKVQGSFETEVNGWQPGQLVEIDLPDRKIQGTFLIQKVLLKPSTDDKWTYEINYGGRLLGIADVLKALVSAQQKKETGQTEILQKFVSGTEETKITDEIFATSKVRTWSIEQSVEVRIDQSIAFTENWNTQPYTTSGTTINSVNGVLNVTSTNGDPMINMYNLGSFDPNIYRYIEFRYRIISGGSTGAQIFFTNGAVSAATGGYNTDIYGLIADAQWHTATIDMWQNANYRTGGNITGWRYDWATSANINMELDYIRIQSSNVNQQEFATVGSLLNVAQCGSGAMVIPQYQTSKDSGATWSAWIDIPLGQIGFIEVPHPCLVRLKADTKIEAKNWKKAFVETDTVIGFVEVM